MTSFLTTSATASSLPAAATTGSPREQELLVSLSSATELNQRAKACQELAVYGGEASIPVLADLLGDEVLSDYARSALENIDHPTAGVALRQALAESGGRLQMGVINSLGVRRDHDAIPALKALLGTGNESADCALTALAMIGTEASVEPILALLAEADSESIDAAAHAALLAADQLLKDGKPSTAKALRSSVAEADGVSDHIRAAARSAQ